jgi:hypothetical protein
MFSARVGVVSPYCLVLFQSLISELVTQVVHVTELALNPASHADVTN